MPIADNPSLRNRSSCGRAHVHHHIIVSSPIVVAFCSQLSIVLRLIVHRCAIVDCCFVMLPSPIVVSALVIRCFIVDRCLCLVPSLIVVRSIVKRASFRRQASVEIGSMDRGPFHSRSCFVPSSSECQSWFGSL